MLRGWANKTSTLSGSYSLMTAGAIQCYYSFQYAFDIFAVILAMTHAMTAILHLFAIILLR